MTMCSVLTMAGCNSSESKLSFTSASNDLYTYYYGQNLNGLFTGDDAGFYTAWQTILMARCQWSKLNWMKTCIITPKSFQSA